MGRNDWLLVTFLGLALTALALVVLFSANVISADPHPGTDIFGFSEFLTALALLIVSFTISDATHKFRIHISPVQLESPSFWFAGFVGAATLISQLWVVEGWAVPDLGIGLGLIQATLGAAFFALSMVWIYVGIIYHPKFGKRNSLRFAQRVHKLILNGSTAEFSVLASEVEHSTSNIVWAAHDFPSQQADNRPATNRRSPPDTVECARVILLAIANKKFCRFVVRDASTMAIALFRAMAEGDRYNLQAPQFARNIAAAALNDPDSVPFSEGEAHEAGLLGHWQSFTKSLFGNLELIESLRWC